MALDPGPTRSRGLLVDLLRSGAPAVAPEPTALPELVAGPGVKPGWQRIAILAGLANPPQDAGPRSAASNPEDELLRRASRYLVLAPVALRLIVIPAATIVVLAVYGMGRLQVLALSSTLLTLSDAALLGLALVRGLDPRRPAVLGTGLALAVAANLVVSASVPSDMYGLATAVPGAYLVGTVFLWTLARGGFVGAIPVLVNVALQAAMIRLNRAGDPDGVPHVVANAVAGTVGLVVALGGALLALAVLGLGTRLAMAAGMRSGREAERARLLRGLHDTVLQTLEVMAMAGTDDEPGEVRRLRGMARGQAVEIRQALGQLADPFASSTTLADDLATLAAELATSGLRVQLALAEIDDAVVSPAARAALHDAAREALRNTSKHARTAEAVLRLDVVDSTLVVVVRDYGVGFRNTDARHGFGTRQSILARLAEVGGTAEIWSQPGRGTRVTLRVPLAVDR